MKTIYTTLALTALAVSLTGLGVMSLAHNNQAMKDMLVKGDYTGYKSALVESGKKKADKLTESKFNEMSKKAQSMEATKKAIEEGNYENFKKSADARMLAKVTSQADFDKLVAEFKSAKAIQDKITQAIKDNNFEAFKSAHTEMKTLRESNKSSNKEGKTNKTAPTDEQLKSKFDKLVAQYKADGSLPSKVMMKGSKGGFGRGR